MKTKFNLHGVSANVTLKNGKSPRLNYRPSRRFMKFLQMVMVHSWWCWSTVTRGNAC
ncbi:hypothetical protein TSMEX_006256 [Taenia solium]